MNDAHIHEMQVQMWKANTWGVTGSVWYPEVKPEEQLNFVL